MTRLRVRTSQARVDTRALKHSSTQPLSVFEKIPVTEGLVECPVCGGGVRTSKAGFSDPVMGITKKTVLLSNHQFGGKRMSKHLTRCAGSQMPAPQKEESS